MCQCYLQKSNFSNYLKQTNKKSLHKWMSFIYGERILIISCQPKTGKTWIEPFVPLFFFFFFLGSHPWYMEVLSLGVKWELQLLAYTKVTAMLDLSSICDLHCSLQQCWILNPPSKTRDWTHILMDTSQVLNSLSYNRNSCTTSKKNYWCIVDLESCVSVRCTAMFAPLLSCCDVNINLQSFFLFIFIFLFFAF